MSEQYTPEPWPKFEKHKNPCRMEMGDGEIYAVRLSREDYNRAKLCVDACAGIDSIFLRAWAHAVQQNNGKPWDQRPDEMLSEIQRLTQQRDDLKSKLAISEAMYRSGCHAEEQLEELLTLIEPIANSHTDNEITDRPLWWILSPEQNMRACPHQTYSTFFGPFWSRELGQEYLEHRRHHFGKKAIVYCGSCNDSPALKALYDKSKAIAKVTT